MQEQFFYCQTVVQISESWDSTIVDSENPGHMRTRLSCFLTDWREILKKYPHSTQDGWTWKISTSQVKYEKVVYNQM